MKKSILYMLILAAILVLPTKSTDVGKLRPVQTVAVSKEGAEYVIKTDTQDQGRGGSVAAAIENLKDTTPATIYLDTAQYLMVSDSCLVETLRPYLKKSVRLCQFIGEPPMDEVSKFLSAHIGDASLGEWKREDGLALLDCTKERLEIIVK